MMNPNKTGTVTQTHDDEVTEVMGDIIEWYYPGQALLVIADNGELVAQR